MLVKDLIEELQKLEWNTEIYVLDEMGFEDKDVRITYDEDINTAGIISDYNNF